MASNEQIALFASLFRGRSDVYARYWEKNGHSGYSPAYSFNWTEFMAHKRAGGSIKTFENKTLLPLTHEVFRDHLNGRLLAGIYPILEDGTSYFLAADFDGENWLEEARAYIHAAAQVNLSAYLEKSKSGNGGHVWMFFADSYPCYKSRRIGLELVRRALNISDFDKEVSFDRLFPNQDSVPDGGFGNLIALPLQGEYASRGTMIFIDPENGTPIQDQWAYLSKIKKYGVDELDTVLASLEHIKNDMRPAQKRQTSEKIMLVVRNRIALERKFITPNITGFIRDNLNFLNPEYLVRKQMGKSIYKVEKYFKLVDEVGESVFIPRGFLKKLSTFLDSEHIPFEIIHEPAAIEPAIFSSSIKLIAPQQNVLEKALQYDEGMIVAPPGSGKTMVGMELVVRRGLPALVLVHRKELLEQWVERIQTFLNIPKTKIGRFYGTKKKIGDQITVGLLQSFSRAKDLSEYANAFGTIIIDECHHIPAKTFRTTIVRFNPHYIYGLTATPKRKWGDEKIIHAYVGETIAYMEDTPSELTILKEPKTKLEIVIRNTELHIPFAWKTDQFQLLAKIISFDTERNRLVADDILAQTNAGERVLVLSERKEHLDILRLCLKGKCETILISGDDSSAQRFRKLKSIKNGNYQAILSTGQFFGEGMDIHNITVLVLAFPFSFEGKLVQYIGRLLHGANPKRVIDYRDSKVEFLERQYKQRQRYYNKI
ncbi:DEAD/DEAH box helicase [bacterium]|nr:MAG: DEAD/DEAH box helicase [bacterium]